MERVSREVGVADEGVEEWRRIFIEGGRSGLKSRSELDMEGKVARAWAKLGGLTMDLAKGRWKRGRFVDSLKRRGR